MVVGILSRKAVKCMRKYRITDVIRLDKQVIYIQTCMKCLEHQNFIIDTERINTSPADKLINRLKEIVNEQDA